jgi:hypothetical protein
MTFKIASDIRDKWLKKSFQPCRLPARKLTLFLADILVLLIPLLISLLLGIPLVACCGDDGDQAGPSERLPFDLNLTPEESVEFLTKEEHEFWENEIIRAFREGLEVVDPQGKISTITKN